MGVQGLWQILEQVGHPIKLEALEGKRLGVDANIWLYKFIRGFREKNNGGSIESHKIGLFNRILKLLFYKIKPIFVFDGPAPILKRKTLEKRKEIRNKNHEKHQALALNLFKDHIKNQYPGIDIEALNISLPILKSHSLSAAEKLTDEDRELFYLPPQPAFLNSDNESDEWSDTEPAYIKDYLSSISPKKKLKTETNLVYTIDSDDDYENDGDKTKTDEVEEVKSQSRKEVNKTIELSDSDEDDDDNIKPDVKPQSIIQHSENSIDIESQEFNELPAEIRYEILQDIKESNRKIGRMRELPEKAEDFSKLQLERLKSRRAVQEKIEISERDICSLYTGELGSQSIQHFRVQSEGNRNMLLVKNTSIEGTSSQQSDSPGIPLSPVMKKASEEKTETTTDSFPFKSAANLTPQLRRAKRINEALGTSNSATSNQTNQQSKFPKINLAATNNMKNTVNRGTSSQQVDSPPMPLSPVMEKVSEERIETTIDAFSFETPGNQTPELLRSERINEALETSNSAASNHDDKNDVDETKIDEVEEVKSQSRKEVNKTIELSDSDYDDELTPDIGPQTMIQHCKESIEKDYQQFLELPAEIRYQISQDTKESNEKFAPSASKTADNENPEPLRRERIDEALGTSNSATSNLVNLQSNYPKINRAETNKVTSMIVEEAKELLRLFGVPYIDAAGEAEAQCATLESLKLTDGTITDDSDIWLFGSSKVYRHFFCDDKYVMEFKIEDIEHHVRLNRENMVCFAMLVGSDYTDGINKIGPVTALEILSEFPGKQMEPLKKFRDWKCKVQDKIPGSKKREGFLKFHLPDEFPSKTVYDGYMRPIADESEDKFTWGIPDLDELREYARRNFDWDRKKIDDKLLPVMKKVSEKRTQTTIDSFFFKTAANQNPELFRSKRINEALGKIGANTKSKNVNNKRKKEEDLETDGAKEAKKIVAKRKGRSKSIKVQ